MGSLRGSIVTVLGLVGGVPMGEHRASPIHRRRARAASIITLEHLSPLGSPRVAPRGKSAERCECYGSET